MDLCDDSEEKVFWFHDAKDNLTHVAHVRFFMPVSGIHRAVVERRSRFIKRWIESGKSVNAKETHCNFSPLHMVVICNELNSKIHHFSTKCYLRFDTLKILDCLLTAEGIDVNARCSKGRTPLHLATALDHIKQVEKLIQAGADVNIMDNNGDTALHVSVCHPPICRLLLEHGARIRTNDSRGRTLHEAVAKKCLEIIHMLLYYNVDANVVDVFNRTPFMLALFDRNEEAQEALLEYVDDFNRISYDRRVWFGPALSYALVTNSPFIKDIIERGADVNYADYPEIMDERSAFSVSLRNSVDSSTFKMVWERLRYNDVKNTIDLLDFLDFVDTVPTFLQVIIESDNFKPAVQFFSEGENCFLFVNKFAEKKFDLDQLTALMCRLLEYGFRPSSYDVHAVFSHYGYCELFRILLYMDNNFIRGWLPHMVLPRLIFDIHYDLEIIVNEINDIPKEAVLQLLEYSVCPRLNNALTLHYSDDESVSAVLGRLPRIPSLLELARNAARKQIWQSFKITNNCQFYTTIDHLNIPTIYKNVLTFKRKTY